MKLILRAAAWLVLLAILAVTISPIQFRPVTGEPVNLERLAAFLVVGGLFALAYPRHWLAVLMLTVVAPHFSSFCSVSHPAAMVNSTTFCSRQQVPQSALPSAIVSAA